MGRGEGGEEWRVGGEAARFHFFKAPSNTQQQRTHLKKGGGVVKHRIDPAELLNNHQHAAHNQWHPQRALL